VDLWRLSLSTFGLGLTFLAVGQLKPTVKPDDYKLWGRLGSPLISDDGHWLSYQIAHINADGQLYLKNSDGPQSTTIPNGGRGAFSDDSKWFGYLMAPPKETIDRLRAERKPIQTKLGLRNLATGQEVVFENISNFSFLKGSKYLVAERSRGTTKSEGGSDFVLLNLDTGVDLTIGNVVGIAPNETETLIALRIQSDSGNYGVQVLDPATRSLTPLYWGKDQVPVVRWARKADVLAFLAGATDEKHEGLGFRAIVATDLKSGSPKMKAFMPESRTGFPAGKRITDLAPMQVNEAGEAVAFGVQEWLPKNKPSGRPEDRANVEVWNTHDTIVYPRQMVTADAIRNKSSVVVWHLHDDSFREFGDGKVESVRLLPDYNHLLISDPKAYTAPGIDILDFHDDWLVDTRTGERTKIASKTEWPLEPSRTGKYLAYFERRNWWLYDVEKGTKRNLTGDVKVDFEDTEDDHIVPEKPPAESAIWLKNDDGLLLSDEHDVWLASTTVPNLIQLTHGRKDNEVYRFVDPNPAEPDGPAMNAPLFFSFIDRDTESAGFYTSDSAGKGKKLMEQDAAVEDLVKSKKTDRMLFTMGSWVKSPDLYLTNAAFTAIRPESKTNPQQANFSWGKSELITYKSRFGKALQGVLIYPANYVAGRVYPMVAVVYEKESDHLNQYSAPIDPDPYNTQILSQNGYFVLLPDIAYQPRDPGRSAVECLEPALNAAFAKNVGIDPQKVGMIGHSWGGYETAFVTTVSKAFAVGVAGAPLTELTSMYNSFFLNLGLSQQGIIESKQGRMGVPFWQDPQAYIANSPVWQSEKRRSPILIECGDADGAVPWQQAQYLYQTLRRMGKDAVLLVYPGENHGLARTANQLDYAHRLRHYLDVYLKGAKPEPWITEGIPFVKKDN